MGADSEEKWERGFLSAFGGHASDSFRGKGRALLHLWSSTQKQKLGRTKKKGG